jgi:hypothetical protein
MTYHEKHKQYGRCYYRHRPNRWEFFKLEDLVKNPEHLEAVEFVSTIAKLKLWDFSGIFTLTFDQGADCSFSDFPDLKGIVPEKSFN